RSPQSRAATQEIWRGLNQASPMRRCRLYLRLWLTRCLRGSRLYPAPAASWKLLHCSFVTRPAARSALARSSPGRHRLVCRGPPALPPPSCFLLAPQTTTAAASPKPFSGAAPPRKNAPSRRQERALLPPGLPQAAAPPSPAAALPTAMMCVSSDPSKMLLQSVDSASAATLSAQPQRPSAPSPAPSPAVS